MLTGSISRTKTRESNSGEEPSGIITQDSFARMLDLEQKRCERSGRSFILLLIESSLFATVANASCSIIRVLCRSTRDTDLKGWYKDNSVFGIIFTEIAIHEGQPIASQLYSKISAVLADALTEGQRSQLRLSFRVFPEDWWRFAPEVLRETPDPGSVDRGKIAQSLKRYIDVAGSLAALIVFAPLLAAIGAAIKVNSKGPVLFRQSRCGRYGRPFVFLKFRSMYEKNDPKIHEEYMKRLISGDPAVKQSVGNRAPVYKMTNDPRVTSVGKFLRRTSLDELPQLFNVLAGDMSLVGPRPPLPYEVAKYAPWHRRRLWEAKPGITGLWQVYGRSRTTFDEMVRMDVRYGRTWSLWLDFKLLLLTPYAILTGSGAY